MAAGPTLEEAMGERRAPDVLRPAGRVFILNLIQNEALLAARRGKKAPFFRGMLPKSCHHDAP